MKSNIDQILARFDLNPGAGLLVLDAGMMRDFHLNPAIPTVIIGVDSISKAKSVKQNLGKVYSDDYTFAYTTIEEPDAKCPVGSMHLNDLDSFQAHTQSVFYLPPVTKGSASHRNFAKLIDIVEVLRSPQGCPWDREQTHQSIRKNVIEEAYEVAEAIDMNAPAALADELGDLLLQVALHAQIAAEHGDFTIYDIIQAINDKLIRRHPHVFGDKQANNAGEALLNWEEIKREERRQKGLPEQAGLLDSVSTALPAAQVAYKLTKKAADVGFEWPDIEGVYDKLREEIEELRETKDKSDELGDVLFVLVNLARYLNVDPEAALAKTNVKFRRRFAYIEKQLISQGKTWQESNLEEMDLWWNQAKKLEKL